MFCAANDVLLSLTEKTKVLAQKCTRQNSNGNRNTVKKQNSHHVTDTDSNTIRSVAIEHIKSFSKSNVDVHNCAGDGNKQYDEMFKSISPRKVNANALRGKNLVTCFSTITGSLRLKRRKSLSDTDPSVSTGNRRKLSAANIGYATTRWYVKVFI